MAKLSLTKYLKQFWRANLLVLFWTLIGALCLTGNGLASANILTALVAGNTHRAIIWGAVLLGLNLLWSVELGAYKISYTKAEQQMSIAMRSDIIAGITGNGYAAFHKQDMRTYVSWLTNDVTNIQNLGFDILMFVVQQVLTVIFSVGIMVHFHYSLLITIAILVALMIGVAKSFGNRLNDASAAVSHGNELLTRAVTDILGGFDTLFMLGRLPLIGATTQRASRDLAARKNRYARADGHLMGLTNGVSLVSQVIVLLQAAILYAMHLTPVGAISAAAYFSGTIFSYLTGISANIMEMRAVQPILAKFPVSAPAATEQAGGQIQPLRTNLALTDVAYAYPDTKTPTFSNLTTVFRAGGKYAITGESGIGKTTLLRLLAGITQPVAGSLAFDGTDYGQIAGAELRRHIAYVEQNPYIFADTLLQNVTLGDDFTQEQLDHATTQVGLDAVIADLPDGWQTQLDAGGTNLSGGQRARVALARNLIRGKEILLLDEPTAALDKASAQQLIDTIVGLTGVTVIMVTHHLSTTTAAKLDGIVTLAK